MKDKYGVCRNCVYFTRKVKKETVKDNEDVYYDYCLVGVDNSKTITECKKFGTKYQRCDPYRNEFPYDEARK